MDSLVLSNITKIYSNGVIANDHVNFSLAKGEIHAIIGENGAGKSTVMKVLYGLEKLDSGEIHLDGSRVSINSPKDAIALGIGMVPQHSMLVTEMTVCENIFLGIEKHNAGWLAKKAMRQETISLCEKYNMRLDPNALCGSLSVSSVQKVSILKALARGIKILILDEPTAVLAPQEIEELFSQLKLLKKAGFSIIIITHKLREIKQLCDRVTIMRAGRDCGVFDVDSISEAQISNLMVGSDIELTLQKPAARIGETILEVKDLAVVRPNGSMALDKVNFSVREGEILCLAGVENNGQREAVRCITGMEINYSGSIHLMGIDLKGKTVREIRRLGMAHIPEDRLKTGSDQSASIVDNIIAIANAREKVSWTIPYRKLNDAVKNIFLKYSIKAQDPHQSMGSLSGGNMQKVIIAREFDAHARLVVADQPTRGVDVGSTQFIHKKLIELRDAGKAVLLISADLSEVMSLADRILVFYNGILTALIIDVPNLSEEKLGRYMLGLEKMALQEST